MSRRYPQRRGSSRTVETIKNGDPRRMASHGLYRPRRRPPEVGGLCAAGRRSRSVRRLVTNPICGSISGSRSTRSSRRLERSFELVTLIRSRAISAHETSMRDRARSSWQFHIKPRSYSRQQPRRVRPGDIQNAWDRHEPSKPSRTAPRGAWPSDPSWAPTWTV